MKPEIKRFIEEKLKANGRSADMEGFMLDGFDNDQILPSIQDLFKKLNIGLDPNSTQELQRIIATEVQNNQPTTPRESSFSWKGVMSRTSSSSSFSSSLSDTTQLAQKTTKLVRSISGIMPPAINRSRASSIASASPRHGDYEQEIKLEISKIAHEMLLLIVRDPALPLDGSTPLRDGIIGNLVQASIRPKNFNDLDTILIGYKKNIEDLMGSTNLFSINQDQLVNFYNRVIDTHVEKAQTVIESMLNIISENSANKNHLDRCEDNLKDVSKGIENFENDDYKQKVIGSYVQMAQDKKISLDKGKNKSAIGADKRDNLGYRGFKAVARRLNLDHHEEYTNLHQQPSSPKPTSLTQLKEQLALKHGPSQ